MKIVIIRDKLTNSLKAYSMNDDVVLPPDTSLRLSDGGYVHTVVEPIYMKDTAAFNEEISDLLSPAWDGADYLYDSVAQCRAADAHLKSCDDDGYCNACGDQEQ